MLDLYTMQLLSWWGLFAAALALGFSLQNDSSDDDDPDGWPYASDPDFEDGSFGEIVVGGVGNDTLSASDDDVAAAIAGRTGDDLITGSRTSDYLRGGEGDDEIYGRVGIDTIRGDAGDDYVDAGLGTDFVYGGPGDDTLDGNGNNDMLDGGDGDDLLLGGIGPDRLIGGAGNDTLSGLFEGRAAPNSENQGSDDFDTLIGGEGDDELWLAYNDIAEGGAGSDHFIDDQRRYQDPDSEGATITDYDASEDQITLLFPNTTEDQPLPEITQANSEDGADRLVFADGVQILRVAGAGGDEDLDLNVTTEEQMQPQG